MNCNYEEQEFDPLEPILELIRNFRTDTVRVVNVKRYCEVINIIKQLERMFENNKCGYSATVETFDFSCDLGVLFQLDEMIVDDILLFSKLIKKADGFEIYPRTDGKISFGILFQSVFNELY